LVCCLILMVVGVVSSAFLIPNKRFPESVQPVRSTGRGSVVQRAFLYPDKRSYIPNGGQFQGQSLREQLRRIQIGLQEILQNDKGPREYVPSPRDLLEQLLVNERNDDVSDYAKEQEY